MLLSNTLIRVCCSQRPWAHCCVAVLLQGYRYHLLDLQFSQYHHWHCYFAKSVNNNWRAPLFLTCLTFFPGLLPTFERQYNLNKYSLTYHESPQSKNATLWLNEEQNPTSLERALMFKLCTHSSLPTRSLFHYIVREIQNPEEVFEINLVYCLSNWCRGHVNKGQWSLRELPCVFNLIVIF